MEWRLRRTPLGNLLRFPPLKPGRCESARRREQDFAVVLMVATVAGLFCQIVEAIIDLGRSAEWWT